MAMPDEFGIGFVLGAVVALFLSAIGYAIVDGYRSSCVTAVGYRHRVHSVRVGDDLCVRDFEYEVTPSNATVNVFFVPRKAMDTYVR